jgi:hypothetical protein
MRQKTLVALGFLVAATLLATFFLFPQVSQAASLDAAKVKAGLQTATPEEDGFVEYVLAKVDAGVLPDSLVVSTFQWARQKPSHKFQYFKRALIVRAAKIGISL